MSGFSADWLALREPADAAARDPDLARRFAAALPRRERPSRLVDLGAGTGGNARALAPLLAGDQDWLLIEKDVALVAEQAEAFGTWAAQSGHPAQTDREPLTIRAGGAIWRFTSLVLDLAGDWAPLAGGAPDGVAAAAFFDLVAPPFLARLARWLARHRLPLYAALTVDGRRRWLPGAPEDAVVAAAFRRHQQRDKGFGPALGAAGADALARALAGAGFRILERPSPWRLDARDGELLAALVAGEAAAARAADPSAAAAIDRWERHRQEQRRGPLALEVGHRDLLALPPEIRDTT